MEGRVPKRPKGSPVRVLLVDDTEHVREMLAQMLSLDGFEVVGRAESGAQGVELAKSAEPDIVVMDYKMPQMDGLTATKLILEHTPGLPVILYTAYLDEEIERAAREAGVAACIGKVEGISSLEHEISALCLEFVDR
jgi:DNA-binding NarL/FixJ family response regulator